MKFVIGMFISTCIFSSGFIVGLNLNQPIKIESELKQFNAGDCLIFVGHYEYMEPTFPDKYIVATVDNEVYEVYDFKDTNMGERKFLRFSTAQDFKKVQCNEVKQ